ncbi:hypothetical protein AgCh_009043 [Apium graveolens]
MSRSSSKESNGTDFVSFGVDFTLVGEPPPWRCSSFSGDAVDDWRRRKVGEGCYGGQERLRRRIGLESHDLAVFLIAGFSPGNAAGVEFLGCWVVFFATRVRPVSARQSKLETEDGELNQVKTRVVKKRVKQQDPLISRVFFPIPEESFELPDQDEDKAVLLLVSLPKKYNTVMNSLLVGKTKLNLDETIVVLQEAERLMKQESCDISDGTFVAREDLRELKKNREDSVSLVEADEDLLLVQEEKGSKEEWVLDSGCSHHICENQKIHPVQDPEAALQQPTAPLVSRDASRSERGILAAVIFLVFRPKAPSYSVDSIQITQFNLNSDLSLSASFNVNVTARNPNKKIGIYYEGGSPISVWYTGTKLCEGSWPKFYQGHRNTTVLNLPLTGRAVNAADLLRSIQQEQSTGRIPLNVRVRVPVRIKLGKLKLMKWKFLVKCRLVVDTLSAGNSIRITERSCKFRFRL